jgi:uncharacterized repeat protein (TIGR01451 family)/fimbrial isopeptide formation D2 family protein
MLSNYMNLDRFKKGIAVFLTYALIANLFIGINFSFQIKEAKAAATASCSSSLPPLGYGELLGENINYTVSLDNNGGGTESGFRPVVELILPPEITFVSADHPDSGLAVVSTTITVPASGEVEHPITAELITGLTENDLFVVLEYPLGSIAPDQDAAGMGITLNIDPSAAPQVPIADGIQTRCGFAFGEDALNNPSSPDPPIYDTGGNYNTTFNFNSTEITPLIASINKSVSGINDSAEVATGPNHPLAYSISGEIAPDANAHPLATFDLVDTIPDGFVIDPSLGAITVNDPSGNGCTITYTPLVGAPIDDGGTCNPAALGAGPFGPGGTFEVSFDSILAPTPSDPSFSITGYVAKFDSTSAEVIDESTGGTMVLSNTATLSSDYGGLAVNDTSDQVNVNAKSLAVAKSVGFAPGGDIGAASSYQPGDTVRFTLDIDLSDYFAFDNLDLRDVIGDGYEYVAGSLNISVDEIGTLDGPFDSTDFTEVITTEANYGAFNPFDFSNCDGALTACELAIARDDNDNGDGIDLDDGDTLLALDISQILIDHSTGANAELLGSDTLGQAGQLTITYDAVIQESFIDGLPFDRSVDALDVLNNSVEVSGEITSGTASGNTVTDGSSSSITIVRPTFSKKIVAINGAAPLPGTPEVEPGDLITFEFEINIPSGDAEDLVLTDYLPQPVFDIDEPLLGPPFTFDTDPLRLESATAYNVATNDVPNPNVIGYSTSTTGFSGTLPTPDVTDSDGDNNSVTVSWTDEVTFEENPSDGSTISLLATFEIADKAFDDGLQLVNIASLTIGNSTTSSSATAAGGIAMEMKAPELSILKEVTTSDNPAHTISNGDVFNVDAGDTVTFQMAIENTGDGVAHDVILQDTLPAELISPALVSVLNEAGTPVAYGGDLFGAGLTITDTIGAAGSGAGGVNKQVIVTYTAEIDSSVEALEEIENLGAITSFAAQGGGKNYVEGQEELFQDEAIVTIESIKIDKDLNSTDQAHTSGNEVTIGEVITYEIGITLPEGTTQNISFVDDIPDGLGYYIDNNVRIVDELVDPETCSLLVNDFAGTVPTFTVNGPAGGPPSIAGTGVDLDVSFDTDVIVTNDNDATNNTFCLLYDVVVLSGASGDETNSVEFTFGSAGETTAGFTQTAEDGTPDFGEKDNQATVSVVEPNLLVTKAVYLPGTTTVPASIDAGDVLEYSIKVDHGGSSTADAFDMVITDDLSALPVTVNSSFDTDNLDNIGDGDGTNGTAVEIAGAFWNAGTSTFTWDFTNTSHAEYNQLTLADDFEIRFEIEVNAAVSPNDLIVNQADFSYTSLPGTPAVVSEKTYTGDDTISFNINDIGISKAVTATGFGHTAGSDLAIGEEVTFTVTANIPEGTITNLDLTDTFPDFIRVDSIDSVNDGGGTPGVRTDTIADLNNADGIDDTVNINYATYTHVAAAGQSTTAVNFVMTGTVIDNPANSNGDILTNNATLDFDGRVGVTPTGTANVTIVEPVLDIQKSVDDNSNIEAGDVRTFTIDLSHLPASTADAFDLEVVDTLPSNYSLVDMTNDNLDNDGDGFTDAADPDGEGTYAAGPHTITWNSSNNANFNSLALAGTESLTYKVTVATAAVSGTTLSNTAALSYDSASGVVADERDYSDSDTQNLTVENVTTISKSVTATGLTQTNAAQFNPAQEDLNVGETVTYRMAVDIPQGTLPSFIITDITPLGIEPQSASLIQHDGVIHTFAGADITDTAVVDGINDTVTFDFGTIQNAPDGDTETIIVEVVALVIDNVANIPANNPFVNTASISVNGSTEDTDTASVEVVAPSLAASKTVNPLTGDAGDTFTYTVLIQNNGSGPAFDIEATDLIPNGMTVNTNFDSDGLDNDGDGSTDEAGENGTYFTAPSFTFNSTTTGNTDFDHLSAGNSITLKYEVSLNNTVVDNQVLTNGLSVDYDTYPGVDPNGEEQSSNTTDDDDITAQLNGAVAKTIPSGDTEKSIGDTIDYRITLTIPEGTTADLVATDTLPAGLAYVPGSTSITNNNNADLSIQTIPADPTQVPLSTAIIAGQNQTLTFDLNSVVNSNTNNAADEEIYIDFDAVVMNTSDNAEADTHTNSVSVNFDGNVIVSNAPAITVKEPSLTTTKTTPYVSGNSITYTVSSYHNAAGEPSAYDVVLTDTFPAGTTFDGIINNLNGPVPVIDDSAFPVVTFTYSEIDASYVAANPAQFTFTAEIPTNIASGTALTNNLNSEWTSQSGTPADIITGNTLSGERTGNALDAGGAENDYTDSDSVLITVTRPDLSTSSKAVVDLNGGDLQGNDILEYTITVVNTGNLAATGIQITDDIPANTNGFNVTTLPAGATDNSTLAGTGANSTGYLDITGLNLDAAGGANDTKTIVYQVAVDSDIATGTNIVNDMTVLPASEGGLGGDDSTSIGTKEPVLSISKTVNPTVVGAGQTATFTVIVENNGDSDSLNPIISDTIPAGLAYLANSTTLDGIAQTDADDAPADFTDYNVTTPDTITISLPSLAQGASIEITYDVTLSDTATNTVNITDDHGESLSAQATLTRASSGGGGVFSFQKNKLPSEKTPKEITEESVDSEDRDKNGTLKTIASVEGPKFHEFKNWEPIEQCLQYNPERDLKFSDVDPDPSLDANIVKSTFLLDAFSQDQYVMSGYATRLDDVGEKTAGLENTLTRLEWAKVLMVSHCLPIYDLELLPEVTAFGEQMPNYSDLPLKAQDTDTQTRWMMEVAYSASYYNIINGTGENLAAMMRPVSGAEAIKMFIRTGEFVHAGEFELSDQGISSDLDPNAWYYEFFAKAAAEGTLKEYINSIDSAGNFVIRKNAVNLLLDALLNRKLYKLADEEAIIGIRK